MRKAEYIFKNMLEEMPYQLIGKEQIQPYILEAIKIAQIDAYNQALEDAAENAELESYEFKEDWMDEPFNMIQDDYGNIRAISKQSILKLKK